jgi:hypothetical protein
MCQNIARKAEEEDNAGCTHANRIGITVRFKSKSIRKQQVPKKYNQTSYAPRGIQIYISQGYWKTHWLTLDVASNALVSIGLVVYLVLVTTTGWNFDNNVKDHFCH